MGFRLEQPAAVKSDCLIPLPWPLFTVYPYYTLKARTIRVSQLFSHLIPARCLCKGTKGADNLYLSDRSKVCGANTERRIRHPVLSVFDSDFEKKKS